MPKTLPEKRIDVAIKDFVDSDWPGVWCIIEEVCAAGESFTYPRDITQPLAREIWVQPAPSRTIVARLPHGEIIGTAKMGSNQMGPGAHVATASFMVASRSRGMGVGRRLALEALAWASANGYRAMQFNAVVETNTKAVELWRSLGFAVVGAVPGAFMRPTGEAAALLVMHRRLKGSSDDL